MSEIAGRCRCGAVAWRADVSPFRAVLCHCRDCRAACGASPVGYAGFAKASVRWQGARSFASPRPGVTRGTCPACGTPLSYMCTRWPGELYVHAATFDAPARFVPEAHVHWDERADGTDIADALPRHAGRGPADLRGG